MRAGIIGTKLGFALKYISGFVFALICYIEAVALFGILAWKFLPVADLIFLSMSGGGLFVGIPIGAVIGIYLIDKLILRVDVLKRQIIMGFMAAVASSFFLFALEWSGVKIFYLLPCDSPDGILGGAGLFYIIGVLATLWVYTIMGSTKLNKTSKISSQ